MRLLRTSTCCCCADLRTGGLVLGILSLFFNLTHIFMATGLATCVAGFLIWGTWLYGIFKERTSWMLPAMILAIIGLILEVMFLCLLPIFGSIYCDDIQKALDDKAKQDHIEPLKASTILCVLWIFFAFATVFQYHCTSVMYSLYKQMKEYGSNLSHMRA